jgi:hypothetical protein
MARQGTQFTDPNTGISLSWPWNGEREVIELEEPSRQFQRRITEGYIVVTEDEPTKEARTREEQVNLLTGEAAARRMAEKPTGRIQFRAASDANRVPKENDVERVEGARRPEEAFANPEDVAGVQQRIEDTVPGQRKITAVGGGETTQQGDELPKNKDGLVALAEAEGIDLSGAKNNEERAAAIRKARAERTETPNVGAPTGTVPNVTSVDQGTGETGEAGTTEAGTTGTTETGGEGQGS